MSTDNKRKGKCSMKDKRMFCLAKAAIKRPGVKWLQFVCIAIACATLFLSCQQQSSDDDSETTDLSEAKQKLQLVFAAGDSLDSVSRNLDIAEIIKSMIEFQIQLSFSSDTPDVINNNLMVTPSTTKDTDVKLTATLTKGASTDSKVFMVRVPQMAKRPALADLIGTWKRITIESGTDTDESKTPYRATTETTLTVYDDATYLRKDIVMKDYAEPRVDEREYCEWQGALSRSSSVTDGLTNLETMSIPLLFFTPKKTRTAVTAFTDDTGWIDLTDTESTRDQKMTTVMEYRNKLYMDIGSIRIESKATDPKSIVGSWSFYNAPVSWNTKFDSDGTYECILIVTGGLTYTGTYVVNNDGTVTTHVTSLKHGDGTSESYEKTETDYYRIFCRHEGYVTYSFLYCGMAAPDNAAFTKQP